jgi:hypothetical protein
LNDFSGAHEGEIKGVEEENKIFSLVVGQLDVLDSVVPGTSLEVRSMLSESSSLDESVRSTTSSALTSSSAFAIVTTCAVGTAHTFVSTTVL